ncbi:MAG: putative enoyl-CoA hydratase echA8 [Smithella sp. PtaU1.Bin162]|nr:MAG: putative enoyl-CoA hydratase echA8 [Smithella sp. PtaU1.Bin162]
MSNGYSLIHVEVHPDVYQVIVNRPQDRNSINTQLMKEITRMLTEAEKSSARAVIFAGAGDTFFSGGADALEMMRYDPEGARLFSIRIQNLFNRMEESPLILIAAINGLCYGGGFEFALACDFRIACDNARMGLPEVRVGIIPGGGGTQRLPRLIGKGKAMEVILKGRLYNAKEALEMGLIHHVVAKDKLISETTNFLKSLFKNPQHALSHAKKAVQASQNSDFASGLCVESKEFKKCFENKFFVDEIISQVETGVMPTTQALPE